MRVTLARLFDMKNIFHFEIKLKDNIYIMNNNNFFV